MESYWFGWSMESTWTKFQKVCNVSQLSSSGKILQLKFAWQLTSLVKLETHICGSWEQWMWLTKYCSDSINSFIMQTQHQNWIEEASAWSWQWQKTEWNICLLWGMESLKQILISDFACVSNIWMNSERVKPFRNFRASGPKWKISLRPKLNFDDEEFSDLGREISTICYPQQRSPETIKGLTEFIH